MKKISIIIPVYQEANNLSRLYDRIISVTAKMQQFSWEYVFINDGSPDDSLAVLASLAKRDKRCKVLDLSRNFGKEVALTAGVCEAVGYDAVICIDADLQHPPELIPKLIEHWEQGAEIVSTIRKEIDNQPLLRRLGSHLFYWLMSKITSLEMVSQTTDFRLYDKKVIEAFKVATEHERMFRGIMDWMGFRRNYVEFIADARTDGIVGYTYIKLIRLAVNSITSFSLLPLRLSGYLGIVITFASGALLAWMVLNYMWNASMIYTPLAIVVVANTFLIGIVLNAIGLVALYIGNIHTEVINRPLYIIRERINLD